MYVSFTVVAKGLEWVANHEKTRWFLVLKLKKAHQNGLNKLLHLSNQTVMRFGQPPLYTDSLQTSVDGQSRKRQAGTVGRSKEAASAGALSPTDRLPLYDIDMSSSFHISIGWTLGAPAQDLRDRLTTMTVNFEAIKVDVSVVKVKIGNNITALPLTTKIDNSHKIIEN